MMTKTIFQSSSVVSALAKIIMIFQLSLMVKRSYSFTASLSLGVKHPCVTTFGKNDAIYQCNRPFNRMPSLSTLSSTTVQSTTNKENTTFERPKRFVPFPFDYHQELTVRIESLTNLGKGIARVDIDEEKEEDSEDENSENDGGKKKSWVVFIANVIPGELVTCRVFRNFKGYSEADLISIKEPSPHRVEQPVCSLFGTCGGCQYQHMALDHQREWKTKQVQDMLERIGDIHDAPKVLPTIGTEHEFNYRNKMTPHYDRPKKLAENSYQIKEIGFKQQTNRRLVDVENCFLVLPSINEKLLEMREELHKRAEIGQLKRPKKGATLLLRDANDEEGNSIVESDPKTYIYTTVHNVTFQFLAGNFFQTNPYMLPIMVDKVKEAVIMASEPQNKCTHLIDAYCGSGLFALTCASAVEQCVGIEVNSMAIDEATLSAKRNNINNVQFVAASAEAIFDSSSTVQSFPRDETVVIIDPPRSGCSEEFLKQLYNFNPKRLVYMSCDPTTQARDAKSILNADNGYQLLSVQPLDLFPQTRHIECLMVFQR